MSSVRIGTIDVPDRIERERYFRELDYVELSALFAAPLRPALVDRWASVAPEHAIGLVAPWVLVQRTPPRATPTWPHDGTVGEFRDSAPARVALAALAAAATTMRAGCVVFRSPAQHSPSHANRDAMRRFFGEVATHDAVGGGVDRVWVPDGLWEPRAAVAFATELGITCAIDPLVRAPGEPPDSFDDLDAPALYFRVEGLGRAGLIRNERMEDLAALVEHYQDRPITIAFASPQRWQDARNLKKLLG